MRRENHGTERPICRSKVLVAFGRECLDLWEFFSQLKLMIRHVTSPHWLISFRRGGLKHVGNALNHAGKLNQALAGLHRLKKRVWTFFTIIHLSIPAMHPEGRPPAQCWRFSTGSAKTLLSIQCWIVTARCFQCMATRQARQLRNQIAALTTESQPSQALVTDQTESFEDCRKVSLICSACSRQVVNLSRLLKRAMVFYKSLAHAAVEKRQP